MSKAVTTGSQEPDDRKAREIGQAIISTISSELRISGDYSPILQQAVDELVQVTGANRGLLWQIAGDQLNCTVEGSADGACYFSGTQLNSQESMMITLNLLSHFPDETGASAIEIDDSRASHHSLRAYG